MLHIPPAQTLQDSPLCSAGMLGLMPLPSTATVHEGPGPTAISGDLRLLEVLADGKENVYPNISIPRRNEVITDAMSFLNSKVSTFHPC